MYSVLGSLVDVVSVRDVLLGNTVVPREIKDNGYAFFLRGGGGGGGKVHYGLCEKSE